MRRRVLYFVLVGAGLAFLFGVGLVIYATIMAHREFVAENAVPLNVHLNFTQDNACTRYSPAFEINGIPQDARMVCLRVLDLTIDYDHGGGCILAPTGGVINAGAFLDYRGPCARKAQHLYRFRLTALDPVAQVIGLAESTVECCKTLFATE